MISLLKSAFIIAWKDIYSEWKNKQLVTTMIIFASLVIVTFSFAFDPTKNAVKALVPGLIWVIIIFSGILGINRSFISELKNDNIHGLIVAPIDPSSIYLGKVIANLVFIFGVQIIAIPLLFILFDFRSYGSIPFLLLTLFLGTFGFISIGTFLSALSANSRSSEMLLPIILFPVVIPIIIGSVQATKISLLSINNLDNAISWLQFIAAYDVIFFVLSFILFEYILEV